MVILKYPLWGRTHTRNPHENPFGTPLVLKTDLIQFSDREKERKLSQDKCPLDEEALNFSKRPKDPKCVKRTLTLTKGAILF